jgi:hypothetical protein
VGSLIWRDGRPSLAAKPTLASLLAHRDAMGCRTDLVAFGEKRKQTPITDAAEV